MPFLTYVKAMTMDCLGFPDAGLRKLRVQLAMRLNELLAARRLTQVRAAQLFGIPQPVASVSMLGGGVPYALVSQGRPCVSHRRLSVSQKDPAAP